MLTGCKLIAFIGALLFPMVITHKEEMFLSVNPSLPNKLLSSLYSQKQTGRLCDVVLHCCDKKLSAHSCVLASFSSYFSDIFLSSPEERHSGSSKLAYSSIPDQWSIRQPLNLHIPSVSEKVEMCPDCTSKVIDFMYLGKIQIQKEHLEHIKLLSGVLKIPELLMICSKYSEKQQSQKRKRNAVTEHTEFKKQKTESTLLVEEEEAQNVKNQTVCVDEGINVGEVKAVSNFVEKQAFICSICDKKFETSALLRQHRETHLGRLYRCYSCRYSSHKAIALIEHLLESDHKETVCSLCLFEAESCETLNDHLKQHNHPEPFFCSICNLRFQTRASLNTHTPKHSTEMPFSCTVCNRAFKWKQGLQSHMTVHSTEKKHLCSECGFSTAYQSTFRAHSLIHTSSVFTCPHTDCSFKSVRKQNFMSHLLTHNKEKPYQCEVCGQSFSQSKNLRRHAIKHDSSAEELKQHCPLCVYETMRVDKLKLHFKNHHPESEEKLVIVSKKKQYTNSASLDKVVSHSPEKLSESSSSVAVAPPAENVSDGMNVSIPTEPSNVNVADKTVSYVPLLTNDGTIILVDISQVCAQETNTLVHCLQQATSASLEISSQSAGCNLIDNGNKTAESFTITFNNLNDTQIEQLTAIVDSFNSTQEPNTSTEPLTDQELFGTLGTRDKVVSQLDDVLLCDEEFEDANNDIENASQDAMQINEECENQVLQTLQSIDSIFDSFSLPQKL